MPTDLLDPAMGLAGILDPKDPGDELPQPRPLTAGDPDEAGLAALFSQPTLNSIILDAIFPSGADPELLAPEAFFLALRGALKKLSRNAKMRGQSRMLHELEEDLAETEALRSKIGFLTGG